MVLFVTTTFAAPLTIIGVDTSSGITFEGATVSNYYTIEFATAIGGPWTNWGSISDQPITGSVMTVATPLFYRIRQTNSSAFPPYATTSHTHSNITSSMLATSAVQTANISNAAVTQAKLAPLAVGNGQIANGAITEAKISASGTLVPSFNADLLDGLHAAQIAGSGSSFPTGGIIMWSGTTANIPPGWVLCDGTQGTPDLRERFIVGASSNYIAGTAGGSISHTHSMSTSVGGYVQVGSHPVSINDANHLPPYYALCFIIKQ